jgi:large subunit ribosomal protein L19
MLQEVERSSLREERPEFAIGDTVDVHVRIVEGEKERIQVFNGTVIARKGSGPRETFIVRRIVQGEGVERIFPLHSPKVVKIVVKRHGEARRAKLYYLRKRVGKQTRLRERQATKAEMAAEKAAVAKAEAKAETKAETKTE